MLIAPGTMWTVTCGKANDSVGPLDVIMLFRSSAGSEHVSFLRPGSRVLVLARPNHGWRALVTVAGMLGWLCVIAGAGVRWERVT